MTRRSYEQLCTLARTLDVVGERWTLLIIRELMLGSRRFTDLLDGLPGISRNLLAERLHQLERGELIGRPAGSAAYVLTEDGAALGPALAELGRWGAERLPPPPPKAVFRPAWAMFPLSYMADHDAAVGIRETYEFAIDGEHFHLEVDDGRVIPRNGPVANPDLVVAMSLSTLRSLFSRRLDPTTAVAERLVEFRGAPDAIGRCLAILAPATE